MTNPTSNFGWQMPTATDLVTDLPADFAVFGQAVDTSMADLKGGTTGQVLAKASNTDMDFVWSADAAGMTNPMTTTGDTIYSSSGSTPARRGIGSTGQVLTVSGGIPVWANAPSGFTYITSSTFSNVATASISGCFTSTYYNYFVTFQDMGAGSANDDFEMVFITAAPADSTSHYGGFITVNPSTSAIVGVGFNGTAKIKLSSSTGLLTANDYGSGFMYVSMVGVSGRPRINGQYINNSEGFPTTFGAMVGATGTFTGMKFSTSSTNITGKITVYGLAVS